MAAAKKSEGGEAVKGSELKPGDKFVTRRGNVVYTVISSGPNMVQHGKQNVPGGGSGRPFDDGRIKLVCSTENMPAGHPMVCNPDDVFTRVA